MCVLCFSLPPPLPSLLQPPSFDPDTTDDPNFYLIRFSTGEDVINLNIPASEPRERTFNQLAKGIEYIVRIDVVNDAGNGIMFSTIQRETLVDCKLLLSYEGKFSREEIFTNFVILQPPTKVFSTKF